MEEVTDVREPEGLREFVEASSPSLLRTARRLTGDEHLAHDLVQAALARCWPKWEQIRDRSPEAYVRTTMVRLQASWWQRRWRGEVPTEVLPDAGSPGGEEAVADRDLLGRALQHLPVGQRQVVVLRYVEDRSVDEVAALCGIAPGTVKSQSTKGLAALRVLLDDEGRPAHDDEEVAR
ncbi:MAG TPA: SigE family RNA polymerase sigma factor [Janibacter terrae]|nr:SigE family RNA polymerase sigma factor [Janibacter terrae]